MRGQQDSKGQSEVEKSHITSLETASSDEILREVVVDVEKIIQNISVYVFLLEYLFPINKSFCVGSTR